MHAPSCDLLDHLAVLTGVACLSDLRDPLLAPALQDALVRTPAGDFSAAMWQEALTYLSGLRAPGADLPPLLAGRDCRRRALPLLTTGPAGDIVTAQARL